MTSNNSHQRTIRLSSLPIGALAHTASYLAVPSRALLAVALDSREEGSNSAIAGKEVDTLDFGDIEKDLAAKLSDDDIRDVLVSTNAVNKLKKLRLANCINITGAGLEPLWGSSVIEFIDLSLAGIHESPHLDPEPPISFDEVLPILESIIETGENCALKLLVFPEVWQKEIDEESDFHAFLIRYDQMLIRRSPSCTKCNSNLQVEQYDTCYGCFKNFCIDCEEDDGTYCVDWCNTCERHYCSHCQIIESCGSCCHEMHCVDCVALKRCSRCRIGLCSDCPKFHCDGDCGDDRVWCESCWWRSGYSYIQSSCFLCCTQYCKPCSKSNANGVRLCGSCEACLCGQCRVEKCEEGSGCRGCLQHAFEVLLANKKTVEAENDELRDHNRVMKNNINELRNENNELKRKWEGLDGGDGE
ncbi:hypothetical protein ACHAWC_005613 [Mediolabrus comicus]